MRESKSSQLEMRRWRLRAESIHSGLQLSSFFARLGKIAQRGFRNSIGSRKKTLEHELLTREMPMRGRAACLLLRFQLLQLVTGRQLLAAKQRKLKPRLQHKRKCKHGVFTLLGIHRNGNRFPP